jgi:hypothetical protein
MKQFLLAALLSIFAISSAAAQQGATCDSKAVGRDGKPLVGAAKASFVAKCKKDTCESKAVGTDGRKLAGAAKTAFMKKCEAAS